MSAEPITSTTTQNEPIRYDRMQKCFYQGKERLTGLLDHLKLRFYDNYDFTKATFNVKKPKETEYKRRQERKKETREDRRMRGATTGIKMDKEVTATVDLLQKNPDLDCAIFFNTEKRNQTPMSSDVRQQASQLMPQTQKFWYEMRTRGLRPYATQVCLRWPGTKIAHALDVLCYDDQDDVWIVEVKTGYDFYLEACTNQYMSAPLNKLTDCPANQHQIQLAAQRELFIIHFPEKKLAGCFVLHFPEKTKPNEYPLKPWAVAVPSWIELIMEQFDQNSKKKRAREEAQEEDSNKRSRL